MSLGDSWLATFDHATEALVAFKSADGVELYINEPVKQLTVSLEIDKGIQLHMTINRKPVQFEQAVKLVLPIHLVETLVPSLQKQLGNQITVTANTVVIQSERNLMLHIKK